MPYRRTDNVARKLAARHDAILIAARDLAVEGGMAAVQIVAIAQRAGIAAGTIYHYFPSKIELVAALVEALSATEIEALRRAGDAAPGPLSALTAVVGTFAARALRHQRLAFALIAEPVEAGVDAARLAYRRALAAEFEVRVRHALAAGHLPDQNVAVTALAIVGALTEGLIGPLAPVSAEGDGAQGLTLISLRAVGVADARARGLVVQTLVSKRTDAP